MTRRIVTRREKRREARVKRLGSEIILEPTSLLPSFGAMLEVLSLSERARAQPDPDIPPDILWPNMMRFMRQGLPAPDTFHGVPFIPDIHDGAALYSTNTDMLWDPTQESP